MNCLIAAFSLSALFLDGIRFSETQMTVAGILLSVASTTFPKRQKNFLIMPQLTIFLFPPPLHLPWVVFSGISFSYAKPVEALAPQRPLTSIFHPSISLSVLGQLLLHLVRVLCTCNREFLDCFWLSPTPTPQPISTGVFGLRDLPHQGIRSVAFQITREKNMNSAFYTSFHHDITCSAEVQEGATPGLTRGYEVYTC